MSIQFDWAKLVEDAGYMETRIRDFLHDQFQNIPLPPFIQSLAVTSLHLGHSPPELTLRTLSDPFEEFYEGPPELIPRELDFQTLVEVKYTGDLQMALSAVLLVNYPSPSFISLPLSIRITGVDIHVLTVIACLDKLVRFSVLCDVDENDEMATEGAEVNVLKNMRIESEIGDNSNHGAVLRNVGKVEKFILEQLRRVLREELVWPGWITLEF